MTLDVNLILIGKDTWAALMGDGSVLLPETRNPRAECAQALLRVGMDPRTVLVIRAGARVVAHAALGDVAGGHVDCGDLGAMERDVSCYRN